MNKDTGKKEDYSLPEIDDDLKAALELLKGNVTKVKWIPNIEGRAELPADFDEKTLKRAGLEAKSRFEKAKPKKNSKNRQEKSFFIIFGEWSASDKVSLLNQNPKDPAQSIVHGAIKDYETKWEAKTQSRKPEKDEEEGDGDEK